MLGAIFFLSFISTLILVYTVYTVLFGKREIINRMQHYLNPEKNVEKTDKDFGIPWREGLNAVGKTIGKSKLGHKYMANLETQIVQAHIMLKVEEFITIELISSFGFLILGLIAFSIKLLALPLAIVGFFLPTLILRAKKKAILKKIDQQLPDTIMLLSNSLKAGYSFMQAVDVASKELPPPISLEFKQLLKEVNLGVNTETALESLSGRVQSEDMRLVILAVLIQRQIGGNLSEILDNISDTIRSRIKVKGEINVLTAQGKISGTIISLLPVALCFALFAVNPTYIILLFTDPLGMAMVGVAVVMQLIGIFFIRKIIKIEV
ncbi:MAG TPA: type II secretion system F family protein [Patescibacteria group bacterium]|nr:type II secretion system F family protein [Patescibacteria group bacterium]